MTGRIRRCPADGTYTLLSICPHCGATTITAHPARYSPDDRYGLYRRAERHRIAATSGRQA